MTRLRLALIVAIALVLVLAAAPASARVATPIGVGAWQWYLRNGDFAHLHEAGVALYRTPIRWEAVETPRGHFHFRHYDLMFAAAARHHVRVAPVLFGDPAKRPPTDTRKFARYTLAVARRYGAGGSFWRAHSRLPYLPATSFEVWNEENAPGYWPGGAPSPFQYFRVLRTAHTALSSVCPHAHVVFGGTASGGMDAVAFLRTVLSVGGARYFDDYALHAYLPDPQSVLAQVRAGRAMLDANGARRAGILVSEIGWPSAAGTQGDTPEQQATKLTQAVTLLDSERATLRLRAIDWFAYRDVPGDQPEDSLGLLTPSGAPKPVWHALRALTR